MKILLPIDGSTCSKATLEWAAHFLSPQTSKLYLMNVIVLLPELFVSDYDIEASVAMLQEAKQMLQAKGFQIEDVKYLVGNPIDSICNYANEQEIDQIIIGSHGRQGIAKFLMGSVGEGVFKHAKQPVLVVNNGPNSSIAISHAEKVSLSQTD